jgi:hypothetical protein
VRTSRSSDESGEPAAERNRRPAPSIEGTA